MALMDWNESYSVGVEHLNKQHMTLINQINLLHEAMKVGKGKETITEILDNLINYTATHFKSEEKLFSQYNFPDTEKHVVEHTTFVEEVLTFKEDFDKGRIMVTFEVMDFLKNWLIKHILGSDMEYKTFFKLQGVR